MSKALIFVDISAAFGYHCVMKILNLRQNTLNVLVVVAILVHACASSKGVPVPNSFTFDVEWSQTDAHAQLRTLTEALSTAGWLIQYADQNRGKRPIILVAPIRNSTGQRVDSYQLQVDFERQLQNRATTTVMTGLALPDTSRMAPALPIAELLSMGKSHNAEFILLTELAARAAPGTQHLTNYQLNVELLDLRTQARVWRDVRTIRRNETLSNQQL
jgi:hypothetical protein